MKRITEFSNSISFSHWNLLLKGCEFTSIPPLIVSSDLNGTLIFEHSMSDMILRYVDKSNYEIAKSYFDQQTSGLASMEFAFQKAGPLTKGLTLRQAIEYTVDHMTFVPGFDDFIETIRENDIPFVVNSTGYSVTIEAIRQQKGEEYVHGYIGNELLFSEMDESCNYSSESDPSTSILDDANLRDLVHEYFHSKDIDYELYDNIVANGEIILGIEDESAKATMILEYCQDNFPKFDDPSKIVHIGDTMGDSMGILNIAKMGGTGIAFNYNKELREFLEKEIEKDNLLKERIHFVDRKGTEDIDICNIFPIILSLLQ